MSTMFYLGFFGWLAFIAAHVWHQWYLIERRNIRPNYLGNFIVRSIAAIACTALMCPNWDWFGDWYSWFPTIPAFMYELSSFYFFFDPALNLARKKPIDHRGKESGWIDPFLNRGGWWALKIIALAGLVCSIKILW